MDREVEKMKSELQNYLEQRPEIIAAWEGGAAATGYLDEHSDLDLSIVIKVGDPDDIFSILDEYLDKNYGISKRLRMPEPTWHGMAQCFYQLKGFPPLFYCDIVVVKADNPQKFTEPDRHGHAVIWFDKENIHSAAETPLEERKKLAQKFYHIATDYDWLSIIELQKALARRNWLAAQRCYMQFVNRHLISLLNLKYRPCKADFGSRYAERDFPPDVVEKLEDLLRITSVEDIEERLPHVLRMFERLKSER